MNLNLSEGLDLVKSVGDYLRSQPSSHVEVVMAPPYIHLAPAAQLIQGTPLSLAGQDCSAHSSGAYTGEVSAAMLRSTGAELVIVGHSERRQYFRESDGLLQQKLLQAFEAGLLPIFCVGENLAQREAGDHFAVVSQQIAGALKDIGSQRLSNLIIAYEPVWAIGTGKTALPEQAQEMHRHIRRTFTAEFSATLADELTVLYGGSVKPENAAELFTQPDVDGGLIGGASLKAESFTALIRTGEELLR